MMKAKFKRKDTAKNRRDASIEAIFNHTEYLMRLHDNHPELFGENAKPFLRMILRQIIAIKVDAK